MTRIENGSDKRFMGNSKNHHWWPVAVSDFWKDANGCTTRISPNGERLITPPKNLGVIGHGHSIKLGQPGEPTVWDDNFEAEFQRADDHFPGIIRWLEGLEFQVRPHAMNWTDRFVPQQSSDENIGLLVEGLVSLAIRSPMFRNAAASIAERFRGDKLAGRERNLITSMNIKGRQRIMMEAFGTRGKFAIIYSPDREFIFGDGFFHNVTSPGNAPQSPQIVAPLTPRISALFARPFKYSEQPRLSTIVITAGEAEKLNEVVQIYSKEMLFYRSDEPKLIEEFRRGEHLCYSSLNNRIEFLISTIPGIQAY